MSWKVEIEKLSDKEKIDKLRDFVDSWNLENMCIDLLKEFLDGLFGKRRKTNDKKKTS